MRRRTVPVLALAALALAACAEERPPRERLEAAALTTGEQRTAGVSLEMTTAVGSDTAGPEIRFDGRGAVDFREGTGRLVMAIPALADSMTILRTADAVYIRTPGVLAGGGSGWVRRPLDPGGGRPGRTGPVRLAEAVEKLEGEPRRLGTDVIRGTEVEGFGLTLPAARLRDGSGTSPGSREELEVPVEVWIDGDDRIRRVRLDVPLGPLAEAARARAAEQGAAGPGALAVGMLAGLEGTMQVTLELFDFGTVVRLEAPDPEEVTDAEELRGRLQQGAGGGEGAADTVAGGP